MKVYFYKKKKKKKKKKNDNVLKLQIRLPKVTDWYVSNTKH